MSFVLIGRERVSIYVIIRYIEGLKILECLILVLVKLLVKY